MTIPKARSMIHRENCRQKVTCLLGTCFTHKHIPGGIFVTEQLSVNGIIYIRTLEQLLNSVALIGLFVRVQPEGCYKQRYSYVSHQRDTLEIMLFVRPTRGNSGRYRVIYSNSCTFNSKYIFCSTIIVQFVVQISRTFQYKYRVLCSTNIAYFVVQILCTLQYKYCVLWSTNIVYFIHFLNIADSKRQELLNFIVKLVLFIF